MLNAPEEVSIGVVENTKAAVNGGGFGGGDGAPWHPGCVLLTSVADGSEKRTFCRHSVWPTNLLSVTVTDTSAVGMA